MRFSLSTPHFFLFFIPWVLYLSTLSPGIDFRDSPEFVGTAFALGISHPAGFPTYSLMAKALTYLPMGSVAFKVNLFSALLACLTLVLLYLCSLKLLAFLYPEASAERFRPFALAPAGLLAFSSPFWNQSVQTEVYTLHALFVALLVYLLILWRERDDVRFLYAAGLVYGLSAGNHATVAFFLPALLVLFFMWNRRLAMRHLGSVVLFFLVGLSVYAYLPVRSLAEPGFDWGNPETVENFFYQVTDRKDAHTHLEVVKRSAAAGGNGADDLFSPVKGFATAAWRVAGKFVSDLNEHLTPWIAIGCLAGGGLVFRRSPALFLFFFLVVAANTTFFAGWGRESFFPSYVAACLLSAVFFYRLLRPGGETSNELSPESNSPEKPRVFANAALASWRESGRRLVILLLFLSIPWLAVRNFLSADRSGQYLGETLLKREVLSLDNHALFIPGISWFNYHYLNDVLRLRDDVVAMNAWDFMADDPPGIFTVRRYPELRLPAGHTFIARSEALKYIEELFSINAQDRPILIEQNSIFFNQYPLAGHFRPHRNLLVKYEGAGSLPASAMAGKEAFPEFKAFIEADLLQPGILNAGNEDWINKIGFFIASFGDHFHDRAQYAEEREALLLQYEFLGARSPELYLKWVDNLILDGRLNEARLKWNEMGKRFGGRTEYKLAEGLILRAGGDEQAALDAFNAVLAGGDESYRPLIEAAVSRYRLGEVDKARELARLAREKVIGLRELYFIRHKIETAQSHSTEQPS